MAAALILLLTGCGGSSAPAEEVPRLATILRQVDGAIVGHHYGQAKTHLNQLIDETEQARDAGDLPADQASVVLAAAARMMAVLPTGKPPRHPKPTPSPQPKPAPSPQPKSAPSAQPPPSKPEPSHGEDWQKHQEEQQKKLEEQQKKALEEQQKDQQEGDGHGDSSQNGHGDGHGD